MFAIFAEADRRIFRHRVAPGLEVHDDPQAIHDRLKAAEDDGDRGLEILGKRLDEEHPGLVEPAAAELAGFAREALGLAPLGDDGGGATEDEALEALRAFFDWEADLEREFRAVAEFVSVYGWPPGALARPWIIGFSTGCG